MRHVPVLLDEVIASLQLTSGKHVVDCTLGDAGHAENILAATAPDGKLLGIDADSESILRAKQFLHSYDRRVIFVRDNFARVGDIVRAEKFEPVHGILMDLGWSTPQFEERRRGFSFAKPDEPLDMRYDKRRACAHDGGEGHDLCTAATFVNTKSADELTRIFKEYGEEKFAKEIARAIVVARDVRPIATVEDMVAVILDVYRKKLKTKKDVPWVGGLHPATKAFQALRIAVNDELTVVKSALLQAIDVLAPGGRIAVITFHSLEDRIVKHLFKKYYGKTLRTLTKKPIVPSAEEVLVNARARSAKLRVAEKLFDTI